MSPRIRIFLLTLLTALVVAPASASAAPSACGQDLPPYAPAGQDQTVVNTTNWQTGTPVAGTVDIPLQGTNIQAYQYKFNCGTATTVTGATGTATITGEGIFRFTHRAQDATTGDWTDWVDEFVRIDSGDPVNTTPLISSSWRKGPATFPVTATDATSPVHTEWSVDGAPWTSTGSATVSGNGSHTLDTAAVDSAGNRKQVSFQVNLDDVAPTDTTDTSPGQVWQNQPVTLKVDGTDADSGVDHVEWQIDSQTPGTGPDGTNVTIGTQGKHVFRTRVVDEVGNVSAWRSQDVWVNIIGPIDLTDVSSGWYTTPTVGVDITGIDNVGRDLKRIQWRLDGQPGGDVMTPGSAPIPVTVSGDGVHELEVRMTDVDDHVLEWHTHYVRIDTVTPTDNTSVAAGWLPLSSVTVNVHGNDSNSGIGRVEWKIDHGDPDFATSGSHDVTVSGDGVHTLETRVIDNAGKPSAWVPRTIKLDSTAPTNLTPVADTGWRNTPYSVILSGADALSGVAAVSYKIKLEGFAEGDEIQGSSGFTTATINTDGTHQLSTRVTDLAGVQSAFRTETIRIDRVAPTDNTVYPTGSVANRYVLNFAPQDDRSGVAQVGYRLDGAAEKFASSVTITGAGDHTLEVRVRDNAGNWSTPTTHTITVVLGPDTTAPTDNTTILPQWRTSAYTVTVDAADDIDGVGIDYVQWRVDDDEIADGPAGSTFVVSEDGVHKIDTRVWDKAGNHTDWKTQDLSIDKTRPVDATVLPSGWTNQKTINFAATDATSGVERITYDVSGPATSTGTINATSGTVTLPVDGVYTVTYSIYDVAGQRLTRSVTYKIDTVAPVNTSPAAPTGWQTGVAFTLTGSDAASGVDHTEWRINGGAVQTGAVNVTSEGTQTLETRVVDKAGNASAFRPETIKVDRTKPVNTTPAPSARWRNSPYTVNVTGTDPLSGVARVEYSLDGGGTTTAPAVTISAEGDHKLVSRVVDAAGNASDWREDSIGIDRAKPALSVDCGPAVWRNAPVACSVGADGGPSGVAVLTGNDAAVSGGAFVVSAQGENNVRFRAVDGAGNEAVASATVKLDLTAPASSVSCAPEGDSGYKCTASATDALSGVAGMAWSVNGSAPVGIAPGGSFSVAKGSVVVYATDGAGNGSASPATTLADRTPAPAGPTPRTSTEAVFMKGRGASSSRLLGQLSIESRPTATTVDLRPLAIGKGKFQFVFKIKTGSKTKTVTKTQTASRGYSKRIQVTIPASASATVALTVNKRSGRRWVKYATGTAKL